MLDSGEMQSFVMHPCKDMRSNFLIMVWQLSMPAVLWKELGARGVTVTHSEKQILCKLLL